MRYLIIYPGTRIAQLSALVGKKGIVFAFEHRAGRLETLKHNIKLYGCKSMFWFILDVVVIEDDFAGCDTLSVKFANVFSSLFRLQLL